MNLMPHGYCLLWTPSLISTIVVANGMIWICLTTISTLLFQLFWWRRAIGYTYVWLWLASFIGSCSLTHLWNIIVIWHGWYWTEGVLNGITAVLAFATAATLGRNRKGIADYLRTLPVNDGTGAS